MIPAGETREIDPTLLPGYKPGGAVAADKPASTHIVDVLLAQPAAAIMAAIPTLAHEDLEQLGEREQQGAQRKEVLAAIAERLLESASQKLDETKSTSGNSGQTDPNMQQDKNQQQTSEPNGGNEQNLPSADQPGEPANPVDSGTAQ